MIPGAGAAPVLSVSTMLPRRRELRLAYPALVTLPRASLMDALIEVTTRVIRQFDASTLPASSGQISGHVDEALTAAILPPAVKAIRATKQSHAIKRNLMRMIPFFEFAVLNSPFGPSTAKEPMGRFVPPTVSPRRAAAFENRCSFLGLTENSCQEDCYVWT